MTGYSCELIFTQSKQTGRTGARARERRKNSSPPLLSLTLAFESLRIRVNTWGGPRPRCAHPSIPYPGMLDRLLLIAHSASCDRTQPQHTVRAPSHLARARSPCTVLRWRCGCGRLSAVSRHQSYIAPHEQSVGASRLRTSRT